MSEHNMDNALQTLEPLLGTWRLAALGGAGRSTFAWELGGAYLVQRTSIDHPEAPDSLAVYASVEDGFLQHYFDSRGVVRLYRMTFEGTTWTMVRDAPDFSPLSFAQRWVATVRDDEIDGRWETAAPGSSDWKLDFELRYERAA